MSDKWLSPSEKENETVSKAALNVAFEKLEGIDYSNKQEPQQIVLKILQAFQAVSETVKSFERTFAEKHKGQNCHSYYIEVKSIVATAFWMRLEGFSLDDEVNPISVAGEVWLCFASAIAALNSFASATSILIEASEGLYGENEAKDLLSFSPQKT